MSGLERLLALSDMKTYVPHIALLTVQLKCSSSSCGSIVRKICVGWYKEVKSETLLVTLVISRSLNEKTLVLM